MFRSSCNLIVVCVLFRMLSNYLHTVWCSHFCYSEPACLLKVQVDQVQFPVTRTFRTVSKPLDKTLYLVDFKSRFHELNCATRPWPSMNVVITINLKFQVVVKLHFVEMNWTKLGGVNALLFLIFQKWILNYLSFRAPQSGYPNHQRHEPARKVKLATTRPHLHLFKNASFRTLVNGINFSPCSRRLLPIISMWTRANEFSWWKLLRPK